MIKRNASFYRAIFQTNAGMLYVVVEVTFNRDVDWSRRRAAASFSLSLLKYTSGELVFHFGASTRYFFLSFFFFVLWLFLLSTFRPLSELRSGLAWPCFSCVWQAKLIEVFLTSAKGVVLRSDRLKPWERLSLTPPPRMRRWVRSNWLPCTSPGESWSLALTNQDVAASSVKKQQQTSSGVLRQCFISSPGYLCPSWSVHSFSGSVPCQVRTPRHTFIMIFYKSAFWNL